MNISKITSIPKTIFFNFRYLPLYQAVKFPIFISNNVRYKIEGGKNSLLIKGQIKARMIHLGDSDGSFEMSSNSKSYLQIKKGSQIVFSGTCELARGFKIMVSNNGKINFGDNVHFNSFALISSNSLVDIQNGVRVGWNCTIIDWDGHNIIDIQEKSIINKPKPIIVKEHTWLGSNSTILKGVTLEHHTIVPYGSIVTKSNLTPVVIFGGTPNRVIKTGLMREDKFEQFNNNYGL